jgi:hypothetical protein
MRFGRLYYQSNYIHMENEDLLKKLEEQGTKEDLEQFAESTRFLGFEDVAKLAEQKIADLDSKVENISTTSESQESQIHELGGSDEEVGKRTQEVDQKIKEVGVQAQEGIKEAENQNVETDGEGVEDLEQLKKDKEEAEKKIEELEQTINKIDSGISDLEKQKPQIDGRFVDSEYEHFVKGLGADFDSKIATLKSITQDMISELQNGNLDGQKRDNLSKSITAMTNLVNELESKKMDNENYDTQQFIRLSRGSFQIISDAYGNGSFITEYNGYYDKFLEAERGLNEYINKVNSDPKNIEIDKEIFKLGQVRQEKTKEKQSIQIERNNIENKIKKIEGNQN